jgi:myo-inositol 2-dehydrogenase / D-chiro-inositol 1-dehydrogenase
MKGALIVTESASSRRDFLKASSLTMAGAAWAAGAGFVRTAHAAGNDSIRVAVIGCGGRGAGAAANCLDADPAVKIVAMADAFQDRMDSALNMLRGKFGERIDVPAERQFTGLDAYQQALACDAQLVVLATPPGFRPSQYAAAIQAGKHVSWKSRCASTRRGFAPSWQPTRGQTPTA